ncbi:MAG: PEP-CTERM sorting domain-containing protein [Akkermansia sp.]|nr:PEP-CTERM sorting domain-containing protein [Akkermansia sp.]
MSDTPLTDVDGWTHKSNGSTTTAEPTMENGSYRWATNWKQGYSSYTFDKALSLDHESLTLELSYILTTDTTNDSVLTLALIGDTGTSTVVTGMSYKSALRYAITDTVASSYTFGTEASWGTVLTGTNLNDSTSGKTSYTLDYTIAWDATAGNYALTIELNGTTVAEDIDLGTDALSYKGLVITTDGGHQGPSYATLSNLSVNVVPEPATATLSLLALAGLAARRRRK